jgi:hypothetical protein
MRQHARLYVRLYVMMLGVVGLLAVGTLFDHTSAADPKATGILEGEVLHADSGSIVMKKEEDGREVRLRLTDVTQRGGEFHSGDKIEAFVTPEGTTTSVQPKTGGFNR